MRKGLGEAMKWLKMKQEVNDKQAEDMRAVNQKLAFDPRSNVVKKNFEITVKKCSQLRRGDKNFSSMDPRLMLPFFSYDFYTFEYRSATTNGNNPIFDVTKRYELEYNQDLIDYLKNQFLKIDFIDESVDLVASPDASDYIGSCRIPLKEMLEKEHLSNVYPIFNEKNMQMGTVDISLQFYNANIKPLTDTGYGQPKQAQTL
jgi:hypothetical protein